MIVKVAQFPLKPISSIANIWI